MKKKFITLGVAFLILLGVFGLSGCDSKENIVATAMFSKNILELPIKGMAPNDPRIYGIELEMNEMFSIINENQSLSASHVNKKIFISKDNGDGTKDYFIIMNLTTTRGDYYAFFGMQGWIELEKNNRQLILMPYHLLDNPINSFSLTLDLNVEYRTGFGVEDFFDFYNDSGWYDVVMIDENCFEIRGYLDEERVLALENPNLGSYWSYEFQAPIKFQFMSGGEPNVNLFVVNHII